MSPTVLEKLLNAKPIKEIVPDGVWPSFIPGGEQSSDASQGGFLDKIFYTNKGVAFRDESIVMTIEMLVQSDLEIRLQGLDYVSLAIGEDEFFPFTLRVAWTSDDLQLYFEQIKLALRFSNDLVLPLEPDANGLPQKDATNKFITQTIVDQNAPPRVSIFTTGDIYLDKDFDFDVRGFDSFTLTPCKLASLPIAFAFHNLKLDLSKKTAIPEIIAAGFETDFQGLYIGRLDIVFGEELYFLPDITATNFAVGTGGISGLITASFELNYDSVNNDFTGDAHGDLFGVKMGLRKFELNIRANQIVGSEITGQMKFPFFEKPIEIELSFDLKGNYSIGIKGTNGGTLVELTKDDLLSMKVNGFQFSKTDEQVAFALSGSLKPLFGDVAWPEFGVNSLIVSGEKQGSSYGNWDVRLEGGWVQFQEPLSFQMGGFHGSLSKLGFGKTNSADEKKFIGFSGEIGFVSGFALSAAFDDLKIIYPTNPFRFDKIDVELTRARIGLVIPNTVQLIGEVSKKADGFGGMIDITIIPTELRIMGGAEFGRDNTATPAYSYMQIMMALELPPPGIQLGTLPLSIRGLEGKYAMNMTSSMEPGWEWASAPPKGIMPLSKMKPKLDSKLLGAGIKLTSTDGSLLVINALLAILIPGPVLIEGRGAILQKDEGSNPSDPPFYALVVIDKEEGFVATNLSYKGNLAKGILALDATMEAYFPFQGSGWYIRVGKKTPKSKRIKAVAYKVIDGTGYFEMYKGLSIQAGFYLGIDKKKSFKVGYAKLKGVIQGDGELSWKPEHVKGTLQVDAEITVKACGCGLSLGAGGYISGKSPYKRLLHLEADYKFFINLPWPVPDIKKKGKIEKKWEDGDKYNCDKFTNLVAEVNVNSEMPGIPAVVVSNAAGSDVKDVPLVNLDARPTIRFKYPINDKTQLTFAGNASNGIITHEIGDDEYEFELRNITLEKFPLQETDMILAVGALPTSGWSPIAIPYGVWVHDSSMTGKDAATTLRLWAKTPFTHFCQTSFGNKVSNKERAYQTSYAETYLSSDVTDHAALDESNVAMYMENSPVSTAAYLSSSILDETPAYPLGEPDTEWKYLGFEHIPIQYGLRTLELNSVLTIRSSTAYPFDIIELPVVQPHVTDPEIRSVETLSHGALFKNGLTLTFSIDVQEVILFCIPAELETSLNDSMVSVLKKMFPKGDDLRGFFERYQAKSQSYGENSNEKKDSFSYSFRVNPELYDLKKYPPIISAKNGKQSVPVTQQFQSDGTAQEGGAKDGLSTSTIEGLMMITIKADAPFNVLDIANDLPSSAMFVFAIGYLVASAAASDAIAGAINDFVDEVWNSPSSSTPPTTPESQGVLTERCLYRLTIRTDYNCSAVGPQDRVYHFRTDGPPAQYLQSYVAWPLVSGRYPHFRSYKPGIRFKANYVNQLYKNAPLAMHLKSASGSPSLSGSTDDSSLLWQAAPSHLLAPEEQVYIDIINATGETAIDPAKIPADAQLVFGRREVLEKEQDYVAELVFKDSTQFQVINMVIPGLETAFNQKFATALTPYRGGFVKPVGPVLGVTESLTVVTHTASIDQTLYTFEFRTSRFENFVSIFSPYVGDKRRPVERITITDVQLLANKLGALYTAYHSSWQPVLASLWLMKVAVMQRTAKEEELLKVQEQLGSANRELDLKFEDAAQEFLKISNVALQPRPKQVNIIQSSHCFFVEFPEPIESARLQFTYQGADLTWACDSSETRFLSFPVTFQVTSDPVIDVFTIEGALNIAFKTNVGNDAVVLQYAINEAVPIPLRPGPQP